MPKEAGIFDQSCLFVCALFAFNLFVFTLWIPSRALFATKGAYRLEDHGGARPRQTKPSQNRIALYKKFLLGPDPKPEMSEERRLAILSLVRNPAPQAHAVLQEVLALAGNPSRVPRSTVQKICQALTEQEILDLSTTTLVSTGSGDSKKLEIYRSYVPVMIALRAKKIGEDPTILPLIHRFFLLLPTKIRREVLSREVENKDPKLQAAALRIVGITRDLDLAPSIAPLLRDKTLKPIVQESLARLTLRAELFKNEKEFQKWYKAHKGKSFESLAEEALQRGLRRGIQAEEKFRKVVLNFANEAIDLGLKVRPLPFDSFQSLLSKVEGAQDRALLGKRLFQGLRILAGRNGVGLPWKATDPGLKEFFEFARKEYAGSQDPKRKGYWLSLATLLGKALGGKSANWARLTLQSILLGKAPFDLEQTLDLLSLFPSDGVRETILKFINEELLQNVPLPHRADIMGFAVDVLGKMGPPSDRVLVKGIRELTLRMVRKKGLPMKLREAALDLGGKLDGAGVLEAFQPLVLASSEEVPPSLRMRAFGWVETLGTGMLQAEKGPSSIAVAERILSFFFKCLGDPESRLREQVCKALESFPPSPKNFPEEKRREWWGRILGRIGKILREEKDSHVIDSLRRVFLSAPGNSLPGATVIEHFVGVLLYWGEKRRADYEKQLPFFLKDLELLLKSKGLLPKTLVAFARSLKNAGLKRPASLILAAPSLVALDSMAETLPEKQRIEALRIRKERASLLLSLLVEEGIPVDWKDATKTLQAQRILGAKKGLLDLGNESPRAVFYLAWAELFSGNPSKAESLFTRFRNSKPAPSPQILGIATLLHAKALLRIGKPRAASALLSSRKDLEGMTLLLEARKAAGDHAGVVSLVQDLLQSPNIPASGPKHVDLLLDLAEAQIAMKDLEACLSTVKSLPLLTRDSAQSRLKLLRSQIRSLLKEFEKKKKKGTPKPVPSKKTATQNASPGSGKKTGSSPAKGAQPGGKKAEGEKKKKGRK